MRQLILLLNSLKNHKFRSLHILSITTSLFFTYTMNILAVIILFNCNVRADMDDDKDSQYIYRYGNSCNQVYDPYEKLNRKIFIFNSVFDYYLLRPITIGYKKITNDYIRARVTSIIDNINTPLTSVNYGLQLNYDQAMRSLWRFIINTTFGMGGLFDIASKVGLKSTKQTFGNTLAHYGVAPGPYLVIPFLGSTNVRDVTDSLFTNSYCNPIMYTLSKDLRMVVASTQMINSRLELLPFTDFIAHSTTDPYIAIRSAIHQNRESKVLYPKN